eukprot:1637622-Prymnesium_polylepis.1
MVRPLLPPVGEDGMVRPCALTPPIFLPRAQSAGHRHSRSQLLFHTITIDEGHRLKNEASSFAESLGRIAVPFRLLLTGTPLQNNLQELWALLSYILPGGVLTKGKASFDNAFSLNAGGMDRAALTRARSLLGCLMIRRVKSEVESTLLPKIEYVLKPPLTPLQRQWYRELLGGTRGAGGGGCDLLTREQLLSKMAQLQKVVNHPKTIALTVERERAAAAAKSDAAAGAMFVKLPPKDNSHLPPEAREKEAVLNGLCGESLVAASGKLALLDRLLTRAKTEASRALIFSQYTITLDVIEEYVRWRWGALGAAYFRLDGTTNRITRCAAGGDTQCTDTPWAHAHAEFALRSAVAASADSLPAAACTGSAVRWTCARSIRPARRRSST